MVSFSNVTLGGITGGALAISKYSNFHDVPYVLSKFILLGGFNPSLKYKISPSSSL